MSLKRGIDRAVEKVVEALAKASKPTRDHEKIAQVASISANNDRSIGEQIADAMDKVGKDGVITVEEAKGMETELDVVEGMQFDKGYLSPYFVTNAEKMEAELEEPFILINEKKISNMKGPAAGAREGRADGSPADDHRRGRGRRGSGHAGGQQAARHAERVRREGSGFRRTAARPCSRTSPF